MVQRKKTIGRTCIACHKEGDKRDFLRVVRLADGTVSLDLTGRAAGRGAYVCKSAKCIEDAYNKRRFQAALKTQIDEENGNRLREQFIAFLESESSEDGR